MNTLAALTFWHYLVTVTFVTTCVLLIIIVLLQKGRGGGIGAAFGGGGGQSAFGSKTGDVFTWVTVALAGLYLLIAVLGNYVFIPDMVAGAAEEEIQQVVPAPSQEKPAVPPQTRLPKTPQTKPAASTAPAPAAPARTSGPAQPPASRPATQSAR